MIDGNEIGTIDHGFLILLGVEKDDDSEDIILELQSLEPFPLWNVDTWHNVSEVYACLYDLPIQDNGACPLECDIDPNLDQNIDIFDIIYLIDIILYCTNCEISCGDIIDDGEINIQDVIIILEIILAD